MKTLFAILIFISFQTLGVFAQEVTAPAHPPPSCNSVNYNPSLNFLNAPDATYDEKLSTGSLTTAPPVSSVAPVLVNSPQKMMTKATHHRKKHKKQKKTAA